MTALTVALDQNGILNAFVLPDGPGAGWTGPSTLGVPALVPGGAVTLFAVGASTWIAVAIDRDGVLNAAQFDATQGWQGLATIGVATLVPGAPVAVIAQSVSWLAVTIDQAGLLSTATFQGGAWSGPETIGSADFVPGSAIRVVRQAATTHSLWMVDRQGTMNIATFDQTAGWSGPDTIGGLGLVAGGHVAGI